MYFFPLFFYFRVYGLHYLYSILFSTSRDLWDFGILAAVNTAVCRALAVRVYKTPRFHTQNNFDIDFDFVVLNCGGDEVT
jgi:hypothetical protein